jgi:hypothetical protein
VISERGRPASNKRDYAMHGSVVKRGHPEVVGPLESYANYKTVQVSTFGTLESVRLVLIIILFARQRLRRVNKFTLARVSVSLKGRS